VKFATWTVGLRHLWRDRPWVVGLGAAGAVALGVGAALSPMGDWLANRQANQSPTTGLAEVAAARIHQETPSPEAKDPKAAKVPPLTELAESASPLTRSGARYVLATEALSVKDHGTALKWLENADDPVLLAPVLALRAKAQLQGGDRAGASQTWQTLLKQFPQDPATAEALYGLGQQDPKWLDRLVAADSPWKSHPRAIAVAKQRLAQTPDRPDWFLYLLRHAPDARDVGNYLGPLESQFATAITPADWATIGRIYWDRRQYAKAGDAYAKATPSPLHAYRAGRGAQLGGKRPEAIARYRRLIQQFPQAPEAAFGMTRLARLVPPAEGLALLDRALANPTHAPRALLERVRILKNQQQPTTADRDRLFKTFSNSDAAGDLRWQLAEEAATTSPQAARQWAIALVQQNPEHEDAPRASFWAGQWAAQLGDQAAAQAAYRHTLQQYPESYYAWRSAVKLGLPVGDFTTIRSGQPTLQPPPPRAPLPAGSPTLQALYQLEQDRAAFDYWQTEFQNRNQPTFAEQYTDGTLRLGNGDYLAGLFALANLRWREEPGDREQFAAARRDLNYWRRLYPRPYWEPIAAGARAQNLNSALVLGLIRQESHFERDIRSIANAVGLMQVLPSTGEWVANKIGFKDYTLENPPDNIKLGTWFLDYTHREYDNNSLLAVAAYNAGPGNVNRWVKQFGTADLDRFVEQIPFSETRGYVENVLGNYWNYLRLYNPETQAILQPFQADSKPQNSP